MGEGESPTQSMSERVPRCRPITQWGLVARGEHGVGGGCALLLRLCLRGPVHNGAYGLVTTHTEADQAAEVFVFSFVSICMFKMVLATCT